VAELQLIVMSDEDPGPGPVLVHMKGEAEFGLSTLPEVHHQTGVGVDLVVGGLKKLPLGRRLAQRLKVPPEDILGRGGGGRGWKEKRAQRHQGEGGEGGSEHEGLIRREETGFRGEKKPLALEGQPPAYRRAPRRRTR
jgi:hypothetical protein